MNSEICPKATRVHVLILQHPQEPDKELGTARIAQQALSHSTLRIGLSWKNLSAALGREAQPSRWVVLYLGSGVKADGADQRSSAKDRSQLIFIDKKGVPLPDQERLTSQIEGVLVLDGTWSQAKTLWWRNPWLLKLRRAVLVPKHASLYRELRREPRRECLSTIESIAESLDALGEQPETSKHLRELFSELLNRYRGRGRAPSA